MSGHSKWATTKRKKAVIDSKRGKLFTKIIREITVAAKIGGGVPESNPRLRSAVDAAKEANMPADNIKRAIQKGTGELPGASYEDYTYEGYGPGGVAIMIQAQTDNRNRTTGEIRSVLEKHGGNMGATGCVSWIFSRKGYLVVEKGKANEDDLMTAALDAGAEDMKTWESTYDIITKPEDFDKVKKALDDRKIELAVAEVTMLPSTQVALDGKPAQQMLHLMEALEDHEDVQKVFANFDIPDSVVEAAAQ